MSPHYQFHLILLFELLDHLFAKEPTCHSGIGLPIFNIIVGVRPHQVADGSRWRNLHVPLKGPDCVYCCSFGRETSVDTVYFSLNDSCKREVIESIGEVVPDIVVAVLLCNLIVESINCGDVPGFVVASEEYY